jgi:hypothetical protein
MPSDSEEDQHYSDEEEELQNEQEEQLDEEEEEEEGERIVQDEYEEEEEAEEVEEGDVEMQDLFEPTPLTYEQIKALAADLVLSTQVQVQHTWLLSQLQDRLQLASVNHTRTAVNRPFQDTKQAWDLLHLYHAFDVRQPTPNEDAMLEDYVNQRVAQIARRREKLEKRIGKIHEDLAQASERDMEGDIMIERLNCMFLQEENEKLKQEYMEEFKQVKEHYQEYQMEKRKLEDQIRMEQVRQEMQD